MLRQTDICYASSSFQLLIRIKEKIKEKEELRAKRIVQIKADILQEIQALNHKHQADQYAELGDELWNYNNQDGKYWLTKGVEIALHPSTKFRNQEEQIDILTNILVFNQVFEKDKILGKKLLDKITQLLIEEVQINKSEKFSNTYILLANSLFDYDNKLAFDYFMLSLEGSNPIVSYQTFELYLKFKHYENKSANQYIEKVINLSNTSNNPNYIKQLISFSSSYIFKPFKRPYVTDLQQREILEILARFIEDEKEDLTQNKRDNCEFTTKYGFTKISEFEKYLPQRLASIKNVISVCQNSNISAWNKPNFTSRKHKNYEEVLKSANEIGDDSVKARYLMWAYQLARLENNYQLNINLLNQVPENTRDEVFGWESLRIEESKNLFRKLIENDKLEEAKEFIKSEPQKLRPYIITQSLKFGITLSKNKEFYYELLNLAKTDFQTFEMPPVKNIKKFHVINPAKFFQLVGLFSELGFNDEALQTLKEFIVFQNKLNKKLKYKDEDGYAYSFIYYETLSERFKEKNFEEFYQSIEKIESSQIRLNFRLHLLSETINPNLSTGSVGLARFIF